MTSVSTTAWSLWKLKITQMTIWDDLEMIAAATIMVLSFSNCFFFSWTFASSAATGCWSMLSVHLTKNDFFGKSHISGHVKSFLCIWLIPWGERWATAVLRTGIIWWSNHPSSTLDAEQVGNGSQYDPARDQTHELCLREETLPLGLYAGVAILGVACSCLKMCFLLQKQDFVLSSAKPQSSWNLWKLGPSEQELNVERSSCSGIAPFWIVSIDLTQRYIITEI